MISGTFPAATASGLMRQTVISFFPSESSEKKNIINHYCFYYVTAGTRIGKKKALQTVIVTSDFYSIFKCGK